MYAYARNLPNSQTAVQIKHTLGIHLNGPFYESYRREVVLIKAISKDGEPLMIKMFKRKECAKTEAMIGCLLHENKIDG